jgi:hypothetical protein
MDLFLQDPHEIPLPSDQVRIRSLRAEPYPDGRRVRVYVETDPFQFGKRPSADIFILDAEGAEIASTTVITTMTRKLEMTLHLRGAAGPGAYLLQAILYYTDLTEPSEEDAELQPPIVTEIDRKETQFEVPAH